MTGKMTDKMATDYFKPILHSFCAFFIPFFPKNLFLNLKNWCKKSNHFGVKKYPLSNATL